MFQIILCVMGVMGCEGGSGLLGVGRWICRGSQKAETKGKLLKSELNNSNTNKIKSNDILGARSKRRAARNQGWL